MLSRVHALPRPCGTGGAAVPGRIAVTKACPVHLTAVQVVVQCLRSVFLLFIRLSLFRDVPTDAFHAFFCDVPVEEPCKQEAFPWDSPISPGIPLE